MASNYTQPPPVYEADRPGAGQTKKSGPGRGYNSFDEPQSPLLGGASAQPSNSWADMPDDGDDVDDFKFGSTVSQCSIEIRQRFVRKVYSVLFLQLLGTSVVAASLNYTSGAAYIQTHQWAFWTPLVASIVSMIALFVYRQSYPLNIVLLSLFSLFEAIAIGTVTSFYDYKIVLQALVITTFVFIGLTLFAMQTKYDLTSLGGVLYAGLMGFLGVGLVGLFLPFSHTVDILYAGFGVLLFSGYTLYDTYMICNRLSPDEWILAVVSLYLDVINLFLSILRLLNSTQDN